MFKKEKKQNKKEISIFTKFSRVPINQKIFFVQQLGIMIKTGISLAVALKTMNEQTKNKKLKKALTDIEKDVQQGVLLSKGLERYPKIFNKLFIGMIKAGEASGKLESVLDQLFIQMKKDHKIVSKVRSAMIYPAVIITAMIGVGIMVVVYVIPNLTSIFMEIDAKLPLPTRILIFISEAVSNYGLYISIVVVVLIVGFARFITLKKGRFIFHDLLLKTPIISPIIIKINLARFCRTFSSLLKTDIPIITTFEITSEVLGNQLYKKALIDAKERVKKGLRIQEALSPYKKLFPPVVLQMISVGEETGTLDNILEESAIFYEEDVEQTMINLPALIEPILIMVLGAGVAVMAIAVIMPMYSLSQQI